MQQLSATVKCVTRIGCSSVTNESSASRFQRADRGDPTVTQIHFKRLALGKLTDRRRRQREPVLCHYAGRVWSAMWSCWDRSPRFALVHICMCVRERSSDIEGKQERERTRACSTFKLLRMLMELRQASNIYTWNTKIWRYTRMMTIYNLMIWGDDIIIWRIDALNLLRVITVTVKWRLTDLSDQIVPETRGSREKSIKSEQINVQWWEFREESLQWPGL